MLSSSGFVKITKMKFWCCFLKNQTYNTWRKDFNTVKKMQHNLGSQEKPWNLKNTAHNPKEGENSSPVILKIKHLAIPLPEPLFGTTNENTLKAKNIHSCTILQSLGSRQRFTACITKICWWITTIYNKHPVFKSWHTGKVIAHHLPPCMQMRAVKFDSK